MEGLTQPTLLLKPFAESGDRNNIPETPNVTYPQRADLTNGFPEITGKTPEQGGLPPERKDFNALGYLTTTYDFFYQAGGTFTFNSTISTAIGGYPQGARLWYTDSNGATTILRSTKNDNTDNFVTTPSYIGTSWVQEIPVLGWNNVWTGSNTFSGNISSSGTNIFSGSNTFSGSLNATTPTSATDHSTNVSTTQWFRNAITNLGVQHLTKYEDIGDLPYTAPIDGIMRVRIGATYNWELYINGIIVQQQNRNDSDSCTTTWVTIPVKQGDVLTKGAGTIHGKEMYYPY